MEYVFDLHITPAETGVPVMFWRGVEGEGYAVVSLDLWYLRFNIKSPNKTLPVIVDEGAVELKRAKREKLWQAEILMLYVSFPSSWSSKEIHSRRHEIKTVLVIYIYIYMYKAPTSPSWMLPRSGNLEFLTVWHKHLRNGMKTINSLLSSLKLE